LKQKHNWRTKFNFGWSNANPEKKEGEKKGGKSLTAAKPLQITVPGLLHRICCHLMFWWHSGWPFLAIGGALHVTPDERGCFLHVTRTYIYIYIYISTTFYLFFIIFYSIKILNCYWLKLIIIYKKRWNNKKKNT